MVIRPSDIHVDSDKAKLAAVTVARALCVECDCRLSSMWRIDIDGNERETFLELAREEAEK